MRQCDLCPNPNRKLTGLTGVFGEQVPLQLKSKTTRLMALLRGQSLHAPCFVSRARKYQQAQANGGAEMATFELADARAANKFEATQALTKQYSSIGAPRRVICSRSTAKQSNNRKHLCCCCSRKPRSLRISHRSHLRHAQSWKSARQRAKSEAKATDRRSYSHWSGTFQPSQSIINYSFVFTIVQHERNQQQHDSPAAK